jgi:hypothetical protein
VENDAKLFCPASSKGGAASPLCTSDKSMNLTEIWQHIQDVHYRFQFRDVDAPGNEGRLQGKAFKEKNKAKDDAEDATDNADGATVDDAPQFKKQKRSKFRPVGIEAEAPPAVQSRGALADLPANKSMTNKSAAPIKKKSKASIATESTAVAKKSRASVSTESTARSASTQH